MAEVTLRIDRSYPHLVAGFTGLCVSAKDRESLEIYVDGAGTRSVPWLPALRRRLIEWKIEAPHSGAADLVLGTADGKPIAERNANRALAAAKTAAKLGEVDGRLSWHSLRHAFASLCATDLDLPATTLARLIGRTNAGYTLKVYARDGRSDASVVKDILGRAKKRARIGA